MQYGYALPSSCEEQQSNNFDEYSDDSDAESEKVLATPQLIESSLSRLSSVSTLSSFLVCGGPATLHYCHLALQSQKFCSSRLIHSHFRHEIQSPAIFVYNRGRTLGTR